MLQTYTFLSFYESVFSHLRHLELTHRKLTHMYMFLMMSGIFLQHCPINKTMLYIKNGKKCIQTYTFLSFYESIFTFEALFDLTHVILCFIFYRTMRFLRETSFQQVLLSLSGPKENVYTHNLYIP